MSVNRVILVGNIGGDPELRYVQQRPVAELRLATNEPAYTNAAGAQVPEITEWHRLVMWDRNAELAERFLRKGTKIYVEGRLRTRTWEDRNAIKRQVTEIYVDRFDILSRPVQ